jgi:hypothetical protein
MNWSSPQEIVRDAGEYHSSCLCATPGLTCLRNIYKAPSCVVRSLCVSLVLPISALLQANASSVFHSWEFFISLPFDWQFFSGKKKFRWPLVTTPALPARSTAEHLSRSCTLSIVTPCYSPSSECQSPAHFLLSILTFISAVLSLSTLKSKPYPRCLQPERNPQRALDPLREVNCQVLYTFNAILGNFAIGTASINLSIRTSVPCNRSGAIWCA